MKHSPLQAMVRDLADFPGVDGCALVDAETGMVWFHAGSTEAIEKVGEAAIEFWRVEQRLRRHFASMGALQSTAYSFARNVVALFPCASSPALVLVCVARKSGVDWPAWGARVQGLRRALVAVRPGEGPDA